MHKHHKAQRYCDHCLILFPSTSHPADPCVFWSQSLWMRLAVWITTRIPSLYASSIILLQGKGQAGLHYWKDVIVALVAHLWCVPNIISSLACGRNLMCWSTARDAKLLINNLKATHYGVKGTSCFHSPTLPLPISPSFLSFLLLLSPPPFKHFCTNSVMKRMQSHTWNSLILGYGSASFLSWIKASLWSPCTISTGAALKIWLLENSCGLIWR